MPVRSVYKKFAIMWVIKNIDNCHNIDKFRQIREIRAYDAKINSRLLPLVKNLWIILVQNFIIFLDLDLKKQ